MARELPVLFLLSYAQKRAILEAHGYTVIAQDLESDLDFTIAGDVASGEIRHADLEAAIGQ